MLSIGSTFRSSLDPCDTIVRSPFFQLRHQNGRQEKPGSQATQDQSRSRKEVGQTIQFFFSSLPGGLIEFRPVFFSVCVQFMYILDSSSSLFPCRNLCAESRIMGSVPVTHAGSPKRKSCTLRKIRIRSSSWTNSLPITRKTGISITGCVPYRPPPPLPLLSHACGVLTSHGTEKDVGRIRKDDHRYQRPSGRRR